MAPCGGHEARAVPAASPAPTAAACAARGPAVLAVNRGAHSGPGLAVTNATSNAGTAGKVDSRSRVGTSKGQRIELGSRAISASVSAAFPSVGGASAVGGRPVRQTPSALNDFEH